MSQFQVSPGVGFSEVDLTTVVPAVSTTVGAIAGPFRWGPIGVPTSVDSETTLVKRFGAPTNYNPETWFSAAQFLAYGNSLLVSRAANTTDSANGVLTAVANIASAVANLSSFVVENRDDYELKSADFLDADPDIAYIAKWPGAIGNSLRVSICDSVQAFSSNIAVSNVSFTVGSNTGQLKFANTDVADAAWALLTEGDFLVVGNSTIGTQLVKISDLGAEPSGNTITLGLANKYTLHTDWTGATSVQRKWEFFNQVTQAPTTSPYVQQNGNTSAVDQLHLVVTDEDGLFSGTPGTILRVYQGLSRATDAKNADGSGNYYADVVNQDSQYIWWANDRTGVPSNTALNIASVNTLPASVSFNSGQDGHDESAMDFASLANAWDVFKDPDSVDVSLLITGKSREGDGDLGEQLANYVVDNISSTRRDCVAFISPPRSTVVNNVGNEAADIVAFSGVLTGSSYSFVDSGYGYIYDRYNDLSRYIPLNGGTAGLCVQTDILRDPWWSPAGINRGQYKNITKLAYNPKAQADRDLLFNNGVNPVMVQKGQGVVLWGDKTHLDQPSAFDAINVRRLFIVLEKAISIAAKSFLFEFNDSVTQATFVNMVNPYLRDIKGRRGITDFKVVCDDSNNTPEVVDSNRFVGDIYIKPARAIRFIQLNFVAVRDGVTFEEIVGQI